MSITHLHACMLLWTSTGVTCVVKCNVHDYPFIPQPFRQYVYWGWTEPTKRSSREEKLWSHKLCSPNHVLLKLRCVITNVCVCQFCQYLNSPLRVIMVLISSTHLTLWLTKCAEQNYFMFLHSKSPIHQRQRGTLPWTLNVASENPTWSLTLCSCYECTL